MWVSQDRFDLKIKPKSLIRFVELNKSLPNVKDESNVELKDSKEHLGVRQNSWKVRLLEDHQLKRTSKSSCTSPGSADERIFTKKKVVAAFKVVANIIIEESE